MLHLGERITIELDGLTAKDEAAPHAERDGTERSLLTVEMVGNDRNAFDGFCNLIRLNGYSPKDSNVWWPPHMIRSVWFAED